ncbi:unnamed protein product [Adineta ricciae]|uniref:Uncharacterized protein n=1 Tax=Adineta ricciae TaxID=249248 RepID=A0A814V1Y5_ADIRI|nr:unnamed protein product [Adineta ricciae]CAF1182965.1 unnamed protein product [Adineta ricciae]
MKEGINWRQLYNESQMIRPEDNEVSTERICRLVNIYKNDMMEQDLHRYVQRLSTVFRCCQMCSSKSYTNYRWIDTQIAGTKNLYDFRLSGQSVSPLVYYWCKTIGKQCDERGQLSDFKQSDERSDLSISLLSIMNENLVIKNRFWESIFPSFLHDLITKFQMYYTYRKIRSLSSSIEVHNQPMKTFRYLFQTNIAPIFVCFIYNENSFREIFWMFRHLITVFNWPSATKIFANHSFQTSSRLERLIMNHLGLVDLSGLNMNRIDLYCYIYRCLKTCQQSGPIILLLDYSTIFQRKSSDFYLIAFLCDLIRFDLSVPDMLFIPTRLHRSNLSFSQPFLFRELVESTVKKMNVHKQFYELIQCKDDIVSQFVDCILLHLAYVKSFAASDTNQLVTTNLEFEHAIACIELCQLTKNSLSIDAMYSTLQIALKTCSFISAGSHRWNEITVKDMEKYQLLNKKSKLKLFSVILREYFLDILAALSILSKVQHIGTQSRVLEIEMSNQLTFLLLTFGTKQNLNIRPCLSLYQIIQQIIQLCQTRKYILTDCRLEKPMHFHESILSDHEWSEDEENDLMGEEFVDYDDDEDEIIINDLPNRVSDTVKPMYRICFHENEFQLKFFAKLIGPTVKAIIYILKYHIENQFERFTLQFPSLYDFGELFDLNLNEVLLYIRRAYACRLAEHLNVSDEVLMIFQPTDEKIYPLSMDILVMIYGEFVKLLSCCDIE